MAVFADLCFQLLLRSTDSFPTDLIRSLSGRMRARAGRRHLQLVSFLSFRSSDSFFSVFLYTPPIIAE